MRTLAETIALAAALIIPGECFAADANDWPTYNCDVTGSRHNRDEKVVGPDNAGRLTEKWRFPAKDSRDEVGVIHATPVVVEGCVYFGTATNPAFYKLAPDGKVRWMYRNPVYSQEPTKTEKPREGEKP